MALSRATSLCRLALRTQWAPARLLCAVAAVAEPPSDDARRERHYNTEELRWQRTQRVQAQHLQFVPPELVYRVPKSEDEAHKQHRRDMSGSSSVEELLGHATAGLDLLDQYGVLTMLWTLVKLNAKGDEPAQWWKTDERYLQVLRGSTSLMERSLVDAQSYSFILRAFGTMEVAPPPSWMRVFWERSALLMGEYTPAALCNMLCACGQLGLKPPSNWRRRYWNSSALKVGKLRPREMGSVWRASEQLDCTPRDYWVQRFWRHSVPKLGNFKPQDFSSVLHACGHLEHKVMPRDEWLHHFWLASCLKLGEFTPQNLTDTLAACGVLGIEPPRYWMQRFWHASALQIGEFTPQSLNQTISACGQLSITPPADWLERYWHASGSTLEQLDPLRLSMSAYACAHLDLRPPAGWLQSFSESFERSLKDANRQALADTAMALAILRSWELPLWPALWKHLSRSFRGDFWSLTSYQRQARHLYQAYQAAAVERPGLLPAPSPELLTRALQSCIEQARLPRDDDINRLCADVSDCLTAIGVAHSSVRWCKRAQRSIDIAIESARTPVAVQVDGSEHYLQDGRPAGSTRLRDRMLAAHGWRVAVVDYRLWRYQLRTEAEREDYLRRLIA